MAGKPLILACFDGTSRVNPSPSHRILLYSMLAEYSVFAVCPACGRPLNQDVPGFPGRGRCHLRACRDGRAAYGQAGTAQTSGVARMKHGVIRGGRWQVLRTVWRLDVEVAPRSRIPLCCIHTRFLFLSNRDIHKATEYFGDRNSSKIFFHNFPRLALSQIQ